MPSQLSSYAAEVDDLYFFIFWLSVVLFALIMGLLFYFVWKYRCRPGVEAVPTGHNMLLEMSWMIAPLFILVVLFHWGFRTYLKLAVVPPDAIEVRVRAFQWGWDFEYPNGAHSEELKVPVSKPIKLIISSADVIHSLFIPELRIKKDAVPGMYTALWFDANEIKETDVFCAEYCGGRGVGDKVSGHWSMLTKLKVLPQSDYEQFLRDSVVPKLGETPAQWGARLYETKNCKQCHSLDGSEAAGPTWKNIWNRHEVLNNGEQVVVEENYVRESILKPQAKIVKGFGPVMPTYQGILQDQEIDAIIEFMKTLK
ncbi:cytochrome c oxidase subunit II [Pajaroellobacter abortibovis]|uniref:Cytochrome c oxidase subunit 2 n=1 Tax=Pajaroellobacter abortibovis TaxID=1882918 RepID=A0A1L6MZ70_9BACT|nr:cytochrome c oxidase subunit II [Pajaroellobacter abortibovis]APS00822.1 cytochrome c oxidase subunit II [Pajaroellobacter abortibovis]